MIRIILTFVAVCGLAVLGAGYLGAIWPPADSIAVLRLQVLVLSVPVLAGLAMAGGKRQALWMGGAALAMALQTGLAIWGAARSGEGTLTLYQKNLLWNGSDPEAILADILQVAPDFVTLEETSSLNQVVSDGLDAVYPHRLICNTSGNGGISVFSRYPIEQPNERCAFASGLVMVLATLPDGRKLWVGAAHLNWPWPYRQAAQVERILPALAQLDGPKVIAGDFNMVPWGHSVQGMARAAGARKLGGYLTTFPGFGTFAPLAIDHVLIPAEGQGRVETRPQFGSDHLGLVATFSF